MLLFLEYILMNREEYLSYFTPPPGAHPDHLKPDPHPHTKQSTRPKTSHYCLSKTKKLLPHIIEEYQYRITNELLDEKICHPKRDKLITGSFSRQNRQETHERRKIAHRVNGPLQKQNHSPKNTQNDQAPSAQGSHPKRSGKSRQVQRLYKTFDNLSSSCLNYKNDYLISLENNRMGKRIINTRSMVQDILTKTYYTYQLYNGKIVNRDRYLRVDRNSAKFRSCNRSIGKINSGIKCFFENTLGEEAKEGSGRNVRSMHASRAQTLHERSFSKIKENSQRLEQNHGYETHNPSILQTYGEGNLNLVIKHLFIDSNPPLKPDTILILQIIQKDNQLHKILNHYYAERNNFVKQVCQTELSDEEVTGKDCWTTASFPYQYMASQARDAFGLKFRLHYRSHIYVRLLRAEGLEQREIGVIKLDLQPFRTRVPEEFPFRIVKQLREIHGNNYCREIFESSFKGNMYRFKKGQIGTKISFNYQLYTRGFKPDEEKDPLLETKAEEA